MYFYFLFFIFFLHLSGPDINFLKLLVTEHFKQLQITKKGSFDSQPQVIKFTSCLPMVGGSSTTKTGRHDIAEILLKVALINKNQIKKY
jgi:hypothetical protein